MDHVTGLRCTVCGHDYGVSEAMYTCPACGEAATLDVQYDYDLLKSRVLRDEIASDPQGWMWRYRALLPVEPGSAPPPLTVGGTPLYPAPRLAADLGLRSLWVKDEGRNPTASLKDRASAMAVVKAQEFGASLITTASTGNAAAALAGVTASVGMPALIFVPETAPPAKIAQLLVYGAKVILVKGTYDQAFDLCFAASQANGWYCRNTGINPYVGEGKKTAAYEVAEALGWDAPDVLATSVGDGSIIGGQYKGFYDLLQLGWIERMPRLIGVQAEGSAALYTAWRDGIDPVAMQPIDAHTIADSISAGLPRDRVKAMQAVRASGGAYVSVSDEEILAAIPHLAQSTGVFAEPAGAAALAGLRKAVDAGLVEPGERVALLATGSGLKDITSARKSVGDAVTVEPALDAVYAAVDAMGV
ncbi:MAG: threonine synthase [Anaerolineae bacterium]|nr:threonine synthase [Anaerolineae bacterium]